MEMTPFTIWWRTLRTPMANTHNLAQFLMRKNQQTTLAKIVKIEGTFVLVKNTSNQLIKWFNFSVDLEKLEGMRISLAKKADGNRSPVLGTFSFDDDGFITVAKGELVVRKIDNNEDGFCCGECC